MPNCKQLLAHHARKKEALELSKLVKAGSWNQVMASYRTARIGDLAKDALKALQDDKITVEQCCTLCYGSTLLEEFSHLPIRVYPLFTQEGEIDQVAKKILKEGLYNEEFPKSNNFFTKDEAKIIAKQFFAEMRLKSLSERFFFSVPATPVQNDQGKQITIRVTLQEQAGLRVFTHFFLDEIQQLIIPSFSMMQACVNAYGKSLYGDEIKNRLKLYPTFCLSTRRDLRRNAARGEREMFVPFHGFPPPAMADGFRVDDTLAFVMHDFYHGLNGVAIPDDLRKEAGLIADCVALLQRELAEDAGVFAKPFLETFYGRLVDMEFIFFRKAMRLFWGIEHLNDKEIFLLTLEQQLFETTLVRMRSKLKTLRPSDHLHAWDRLKEAFTAQMLQEDPDQSKTMIKRNAFTHLFEQFYKQSGVFQKLAESIYKSGFFQRLSISEANLNRAKQAIHVRKRYAFIELLEAGISAEKVKTKT